MQYASNGQKGHITMKKDEKILSKWFGKKEPFKVPKGYFDSFASNLMKHLPERSVRQVKVAKMNRIEIRTWRPISIAAATVCAIAIGATAYFGSRTVTESSIASNQSKVLQSQYDVFDEMADYTMTDNEDFYAYVADF